MLLHSSSLAKLKSDGKREASSIIVDAIEQACDYFAKLSKWFVSKNETLNTFGLIPFVTEINSYNQSFKC